MLTVVLVVLWLVVLIELVFILALARQVGRILMRMGPSGANPLPGAQGPKIGEKIAPVEVATTENILLALPVANKNTLVAFVSFSDCASCRGLVDALCTFASSERDRTATVVAPASQTAADAEYVRRLSLAGAHVILDGALHAKLAVSSYPYAIVLDKEGIIQAKGLVNTLEHVENLVAAAKADPMKEKEAVLPSGRTARRELYD